MTSLYGNPSSLHSKGLEAEHELTKAREAAASVLGAAPEEIIFTSGGTEANNTAVFGAVRALQRRGKRIVTSAVEHSSVAETMQQLETEGFEVIYLTPEKDGSVHPDQLRNAITKDTILVSLMKVNNETGAIQPVEAIRRIVDRTGSPALIHTDAVQAFLKMPLNVRSLGADIISFSGHKIHAPKGVGGLWIRKGARILPLHRGGLQEKKLRPGTEPVPAICAMGEAIEEYRDIAGNSEYISGLNSYLRERLSTLDSAHINSPENALPYILNFSLPGLRSETILHFLAERGIYVSSGSACSKGQKSHVLSALGLAPEIIDSAVRVSFSDENTKEDIDFFISSLETALSTLARSTKK